MAISLASLRRSGEAKPQRILVYGTHGVGKTSLAAAAPDPVFIQLEDGLGTMEAATFGVLKNYDAVLEAIDSLYSETHDFKTVVVDTLDWLEPLVWAEACARGNWKSIEDPGYGKGYVAAAEIWHEFMSGTNALRDDKGMTVLLLAHAEIKRFESPEIDPYDRYQPKLHARASALVQENVDAVLFHTQLTSVVKIDPKDKNSRVRGVGGGQRVIYSEERPAHLGKNRYRMPYQIVLPDDPAAAWGAVAQHIPYYATTQKEAA